MERALGSKSDPIVRRVQLGPLCPYSIRDPIMRNLTGIPCDITGSRRQFN